MNKNLFKTAVSLFLFSIFLIPRISGADILYNDIEDLIITSFETIDLDGNGTDDFSFSVYYDDWDYGMESEILTPYGSPDANQNMHNGDYTTTKLALGDSINTSQVFTSSSYLLEEWDYDGYGRRGDWDEMAAGDTGYIGFKFLGNDELEHFGWFQAHVDPDSFNITVFDYAYEGTPGTGIAAGDIGAVPVPGAVWLIGSAMLGLLGIRRKN